ncbi:hypothetical protein [Streptomyces sp. UNOC14_S4]|uniref:hypothetical protein n=1 Tax=Streptomyces sp. UNOC14_S4 TaxID=2872340 RepID=UPI001E647C8E|nr:hypothetical protein [Streptomyces sp. UNOC14_S4]MCC3766912.1 hypothetical protein [Streptomyces sp. UNOC14_S4]
MAGTRTVHPLDLFGPAFHLLCLGDAGRLPAVEEAFSRRHVPFRLVRPDGHVAWRGARLPEAPGLLFDTVRGAGPAPGAGAGPCPGGDEPM